MSSPLNDPSGSDATIRAGVFGIRLFFFFMFSNIQFYPFHTRSVES